MSQSSAIFWPMIVQVILIYVVYFRLFNRRKDAIKAGKAGVSQFRENLVEPEETRFLKANLTNQYELPVLFFAGCISLHVTGHATTMPVFLAWAFVASRILHAVIHTGQNRMRHRVPVFIAGYAINGLLWFWLAVNIALN